MGVTLNRLAATKHIFPGAQNVEIPVGLNRPFLQSAQSNSMETSSPARYGLVPKFLVTSTVRGLSYSRWLKGLCQPI